MSRRVERRLGASLLAVLFIAASSAAPPSAPAAEELLISRAETGRYGGQIVANQRAAPKTLNPVIVVDIASREVIGCTSADLIHINRETQRTEPALAASWTVSPDGLHYVLRLRRGVRFSDGHPFDADDVVFSFGAYLDERLHSPQRDLLLIGGKPIAVRKIDADTVAVDLPAPYAAAE